MKQNAAAKVWIASLFFLVMIVSLCSTIHAQSAVKIATDKDTYNYGEIIRVNYFQAPGHPKDWICIVPEGTPDTEEGEYQYIPEGSNQGTLSFETTSPGQFEARAYYNYTKKGFVVSSRHRFSVKSTAEYEKKVADALQLAERPLNRQMLMESTIPQGNGLIYIFRESWYLNEGKSFKILANDKDLFVMPDASYYAYSVPAGKIKLSSKRYVDPDKKWWYSEGIENCELTINVKAGCAYYFRVKMVPKWDITAIIMDPYPHEEGAALINSGKFTQIH